MLSKLKEGDQVVVWRLDRLGRSLPHLIEIVSTLGDQGVHFQSLTESIDTSSAGGELLFHILGALAQFERSLISERTKAGMASAKARGAAGAVENEHISVSRFASLAGIQLPVIDR